MRVLILLAVLLTATLTYAQDLIILRTGEEVPAKVLEVTQTDLKFRKSANPEGPVYTSPLRDVLLIKYANGTKDVLGQPFPAFPGLTPAQTPTAGAANPTKTLPGMAGLHYHRGLFSRYFVTEGGQRLTSSETRSLIEVDQTALTDYRRGQSLRRWTYITAIPAFALLGTGIGVLVSEKRGNESPNKMMTETHTPDNNQPTSNTGERNEGNSHGDRAVVGAALLGGGVVLGIASVWLDHRATVHFRRAADRFNSRPATTLRFAPASRGLGMSVSLRF